MKNTIKLLAVLLVVFTFNSCDEAKALADVNFDTTVSQDITIHIGENQEYISDEMTLNIDNADTHAYLDRLKNVTIKKLTYKFKDFTGNENCTINVEISTDNNVFETKEFTIKQEVDNETVFEITDVNKINAMSTALQNNKSVTFKMEGEVSNGEADFKVEVTAELEVVANPL